MIVDCSQQNYVLEEKALFQTIIIDNTYYVFADNKDFLRKYLCN
jgi:hypothetical protein